MPKYGTVRTLAITAKVLRHDGSDGHGNSDEAVMIDADPDDIEPGQTALWRPPRASFASTAGLEPVQRPNPGFHRLHHPEELFLLVDIRGDIVTKKGEERRDGERLITVGDNLEVDRMPIEAEL